ncbi:FAD-dependent oxidoreductase [Nocardiopsis sp. EMB25]|uniref:dihydrolipoyl dehydrogenase family protein n=1 Tax=Nocardiopsis sp. EMB25 TaxID=2835867 RepID=UPI0022834FD9|nr:FAD-dependent oxidoreductase [Nocardiopsis sp. EMB25]MCY9785247.1 FAD-dependent oxidoreductase [Nocardiopsis sp. EMB25]
MSRARELVVIGGGAAGLSAARTARALGAHPVLVTEGPPGGDCTFTGCVPSKTLLAAAAGGEDFATAMRRVRAAVGRVAATEDEAALRAEGIEVMRGRAMFLSPDEVEVHGRVLSADRVVVATGSAPLVPDIPGLPDVAPLTSDTVFALRERPRSLVVLGGGAIGCELAQAFARLGSAVTVVEAAGRLLPSEDPEASAVIAARFADEGVVVRTAVKAVRATSDAGGVRLELTDGEHVRAERVLVAVGRRPNTAWLRTGAAGIDLDHTGAVVTTDRLATTSPSRVYAAGDVTGRYALTHAAHLMGRVAARNALARWDRVRLDDAVVPRVVFTDPEVAQVGVTEREAARTHPDARVAYLPMAEVDRAITDGRGDGFVRIITRPRRLLGHTGGGRVIGATVVGARAGELVHELALAMRTGMFAGRLAQTVHAYPTHAVAVQQAAAQFVGGHGGRVARPVEGLR